MRKVTTALAALAAALVAATAATAEGLSAEQLATAGWTCFQDPINPRIVCLNPGHPRPSVPADPDGQQSLQDMVFGLDGSFRGTIHLIRADLYHGQPCPQTGGSWLFIPRIGYYSCENV